MRSTKAATCALVLLCVLLVKADSDRQQPSTIPTEVPPPIAKVPALVAERARANGKQFEWAVAASRKLLLAWLTHADARTLLLPDRLDADRKTWIYTPHNSGADLYPYLVLTAQLTDPDLYSGRMMEMLRNELRFTCPTATVPATSGSPSV